VKKVKNRSEKIRLVKTDTIFRVVGRKEKASDGFYTVTGGLNSLAKWEEQAKKKTAEKRDG